MKNKYNKYPRYMDMDTGDIYLKLNERVVDGFKQYKMMNTDQIHEKFPICIYYQEGTFREKFVGVKQ